MTDGRHSASADGALKRVNSEEQDEFRDEDMYLPPRKTVHPSEKYIWTRRFYLVLIWLFVLLTAGLLVWGFRSAG